MEVVIRQSDARHLATEPRSMASLKVMFELALFRFGLRTRGGVISATMRKETGIPDTIPVSGGDAI